MTGDRKGYSVRHTPVARGAAHHQRIPITLSKDEGKERGLAVFSLLNVHYEGRIEDPVRGVGRFVRKVELRNQDRLIRSLSDDVDVAGAAGVEPRHDRFQLE